SRARLQSNLAAALPLLKGDDADGGTRSGDLRNGKAWALPLAGAAAVAALALYVPWGGQTRSVRTAPALVATERAPNRAAVPRPTPTESAAITSLPEPTIPAEPEPAEPASAPAVAAPAEPAANPPNEPKPRRATPNRPAIARAEASARAYEVRASAEDRFQWGDLEGAETLARAAVRNLASSPRAFYLLGVVLLARGDANKAKDAFERTLALDPSYTDADAKLRLATERAALSKQN
ncbi:MAG TPA: tetratricopeptide repeat protein, partial [Polyangia bacterium]